MQTRSYQDLKKEVWERGTCAGCGACVAVCPADALCFATGGGGTCPSNIGYCKQATDEVNCGACFYVCPRTTPPSGLTLLGPCLEIVSARAAFEIPRKQSGGAVTAVLANALDEGLIDAVVTVTEDRYTLRPSSVVITSREELIHTAGSRYNWWVPLVSALKTAVITKKYRKIAVVGLPCVVQALRRIKEADHDLLRPYGRSIRLIIGLFCTESFDYQALVEGKLRTQFQVPSWKIDRMDVKGRLEIRLVDGTSLVLPLSELNDTVRPGCHFCQDFTAVFSDLSAGAVGSPKGFTTLLIRNETGRMFVESAERNGQLMISRETDMQAIEKLAALKKERPANPE